MIRFVVGKQLISLHVAVQQNIQASNVNTVRNAYSGLQIDGIGVINSGGRPFFLTKAVIAFRPLIAERQYAADEENGILMIVWQKRTPEMDHHITGWHWTVQKLEPVVFQNIDPGRVNGVTAARYIDHVFLHCAKFCNILLYNRTRCSSMKMPVNTRLDQLKTFWSRITLASCLGHL